MSKEHNFFSRDPRRAVVISWTVGVPIFVCLLILGLLGDGEGFWGNRPYLTNILTALTGAGIGVPFALTVLNGYARIQATAAEWHSARNYANQLVSSLNENMLLAIGRDASGMEMKNFVRRLKVWSMRFDELNESMNAPEFPDRERALNAHRGVFEALTREVQELSVAADSLLLPCEEDSADAETQFNLDWNTLDRVVRPRIDETKGNWVPVDVYRVLSYRRHKFLSSDYISRGLDQLASELKYSFVTESTFYIEVKPRTYFPDGPARVSPPRLSELIGRIDQLLELWTAVCGLRSAADSLRG
jgi:hypothetical protein